ncbi:hypothetical protein QII47_gp3 [ssRNA phage Gerhypos.4_10]|uniref:Uncharacterized protein n=2 Tax=Norzivirales TaxID=2842247 RepID=A0A8S5L2F3_9VIRU|nr:hypothetical protein QII47_gp3 [ssRNA phage Gerhypos.4_10]QDH89641.1 MAG: hypothetical protein H2Bulk351293_000002 [Leviviridae sp.]QDH90227.1 MAG: hypothetical protein H4Bulk46337_000002 [Leviviridae sp.]DAD51675.1 TPA_asm: hypothetical protein [ssRNA phage Gerhypos.4_10]
MDDHKSTKVVKEPPQRHPDSVVGSGNCGCKSADYQRRYFSTSGCDFSINGKLDATGVIHLEVEVLDCDGFAVVLKPRMRPVDPVLRNKYRVEDLIRQTDEGYFSTHVDELCSDIWCLVAEFATRE